MIDGLRAARRGLGNFYWNGYPYIWSNLAFVALSLPLVTAPAALSALFHVGHLAHTDPSEADLAAFWGAFRSNLWRALPWGVFNVLFAIINFNNLLAFASINSPVAVTLRAVWMIASVVWLGELLYTWPIYYEMSEPTVFGATRNALIMVIRNPVFTVVIVLVIGVVAVISTLLFASWLLLTWGAIASMANAAVLDRVERFRAASHPRLDT
jgi:uncharacterized membrane protein YesL